MAEDIKVKELRALVLPGGGVKGAYQVGALIHLLLDRGEQFDIITGVSVGALNGSFLAQYNKKELGNAVVELNTLWLGVNNRKIKRHWIPFSFFHALWKKSLYNSAPLENLVEEKLDAEKIKNSDILLRVGCTDINTGEYFDVPGDSPIIKDAVKASAAFPVFFKPVKINGHEIVDGGVSNPAPLKTAIMLGATHITIINTGPLIPEKVNAGKFSALTIAKRSIELQGDEIVRGDLQDFLEVNEGLKNGTLDDSRKRVIDYTYIGPDSQLASDPLEFNPKEIVEMIKKGYNKAVEVKAQKK